MKILYIILLLVSTNCLGNEYIVYYKDSEPYLRSENGIPKGHIADIVRTYAISEKLNIKFVKTHTVNELLDAVTKTHNSIGIGAISITKDRLTKVQFSVPYAQSPISLGVKNVLSTYQILSTFLKILYAFLPLLVALVTVSILLSIERFTIKNLGNNLWLSLVTATTVGYGDMVPKTVLNRIIIGFWMLISTYFLALFTAVLTTSLSLSINNKFEPKSVGYVIGTSSELACKTHYDSCVGFENLKSMISSYNKDEVEGLIYDENIVEPLLDDTSFKLLQIDSYAVILNKKVNPYHLNQYIM